MATFLKKTKKTFLKEIYAFNEVSNFGVLFQWNLGDQWFLLTPNLRSFVATNPNWKGRFPVFTHGGGCAKQLLLYQCPKCMERIGSKTMVMQCKRGCLVVFSKVYSWGMKYYPAMWGVIS